MSKPCNQVTGTIKIGTCGFGMAQAEYARTFSCVEVQHTFYEPPRLTTLNRWRTQIPADFEFALKAWQLITHEARSPTYRRLKRKLSTTEKAEAGSFRATEIVSEAWEATLAAAQALRAKTILFQCPSSFKQTADNIARMEKFFSSIDRRDLNLCWEPRGDWDAAVIRSICVSLELCHVVDPFIAKTVTPEKHYFRLHGRGGWRYEYQPSELEELATALVNSDGGYVFFNNSKMTADALKFCKLLDDLNA